MILFSSAARRGPGTGGACRRSENDPDLDQGPDPLTDPIYDLPEAGGGMTINGRWHTEHALERMAPDTIQVRALTRTRAVERLKRIGITPDSPAWDKCLRSAVQNIEPRGVPPSVVEAEIAKTGSTSVRGITARRGSVVITVIPR